MAAPTAADGPVLPRAESQVSNFLRNQPPEPAARFWDQSLAEPDSVPSEKNPFYTGTECRVAASGTGVRLCFCNATWARGTIRAHRALISATREQCYVVQVREPHLFSSISLPARWQSLSRRPGGARRS